jgi:hypothetical protein
MGHGTHQRQARQERHRLGQRLRSGMHFRPPLSPELRALARCVRRALSHPSIKMEKVEPAILCAGSVVFGLLATFAGMHSAVVVMLQAVGSAPALKQTKFKINATEPFEKARPGRFTSLRLVQSFVSCVIGRRFSSETTGPGHSRKRNRPFSNPPTLAQSMPRASSQVGQTTALVIPSRSLCIWASSLVCGGRTIVCSRRVEAESAACSSSTAINRLHRRWTRPSAILAP